MKKLILILLVILPLLSVSQNDYDKMSELEKNIITISVNMKKDTTFFINNLIYDIRSDINPSEGFESIVFSNETQFLDLYFLNNQLIGANIFYYNKKDAKQLFQFISKNLYRIYDKKYKYRWIFANLKDQYVMTTVLDKKNKLLTIAISK